MSKHNSIFGQILQLIPRYEFEKAVKQHNGDFASKGFTCWEQFVSMMFAQISGQTGLRGIEIALDSVKNLLYHIGVKKIKRSTLSYANVHEVNSIKEMDLQKGEVLTFDKGYMDFKQFAKYCNAGIYFVTRLKRMQ